SFSIKLLSPLLSSLFPYTTLIRSAGNLSAAHNQNLNKIDADYQNQTKQINQEIANHDQAVKSATTNVDNQINAASDTENTAQKADRKSTRLNSSHVSISYAVFCLK